EVTGWRCPGCANRAAISVLKPQSWPACPAPMVELVRLKLMEIPAIAFARHGERHTFYGTSRSVTECMKAKAGPSLAARTSAAASAGITAYGQRLFATTGAFFHASKRWTRLAVDGPPLTSPVANSGMV